MFPNWDIKTTKDRNDKWYEIVHDIKTFQDEAKFEKEQKEVSGRLIWKFGKNDNCVLLWFVNNP